jgi:UDP-N-acetylglucosamine 4-epimerase
MNALAMLTQNPQAINTVYNTAYGDRNTLNNLVGYLKSISRHTMKELECLIVYGPNRAGDIPHSLASIDKTCC